MIGTRLLPPVYKTRCLGWLLHWLLDKQERNFQTISFIPDPRAVRSRKQAAIEQMIVNTTHATDATNVPK